jgi:hypothetical protein
MNKYLEKIATIKTVHKFGNRSGEKTFERTKKIKDTIENIRSAKSTYDDTKKKFNKKIKGNK